MNIIESIKKNRTLVHGSLFTIYSFINQGSNFLLLIILAKYILPDDYGHLSLFNTVVLFLGYFMALSSSGYLSVSFFKSNEDDFKKVLTSIIVLALISMLFFLCLSLLFNTSKLIDFGFPTYLLIHAVLISFCVCVSNLYLDYLRVQEKVGKYGFFSVSNAILNFTLSLVFVIFLHQEWIGRVNAQLFCCLVYSFLAFVFFKKANIFIFDFSWKRYLSLIKWGVPLIPHLGSIWIRQGGDRYIINYFHSTSDVGLFSFALNLSSVIIMIGLAFNSTNSVYIYRVLSDKEITDKWIPLKNQTRKLFLVFFAFTIISSVFIFLFVPILLPQYVGAVKYFLILSLYGFLQCVYLLYCNYLFYYDSTKTLMAITFVTSILHLLLSLVITRYSLFLTCILYVFIQLIIVLLIYFKSKRLLRANSIIVCQ